jgi:ferredoxin-NADP reductase
MFRRHPPAPHADHEYFICGPDRMMDAIEKALGELKVPLSKYHSERHAFASPQGKPMRRLFADRLVVATAVSVILMSAVFAILRVAG